MQFMENPEIQLRYVEQSAEDGCQGKFITGQTRGQLRTPQIWQGKLHTPTIRSQTT